MFGFEHVVFMIEGLFGERLELWCMLFIVLELKWWVIWSNWCVLVMQALKSLILERMGKSDEALSVCLNAKDLLYKNDSLLMDDLTLSTLQIVFQRLDRC